MSTERWLVTGASGQLGSHVIRRLGTETSRPSILALAHRHDIHQDGVDVLHADLAEVDTLGTIVTRFRPTHVIHLGAMTAVGDCYSRPADADRVNTQATATLAELATESAARFVFSSTDMVFAGDAAPYRESDTPQPLSHYGRTKVAAEQRLAAIDRTLVVRVPLMIGTPHNARQTTFVRQIASLRSGAPLHLFTDEHRTPVCLADAARALVGLARSEMRGVIHVAGPEQLSRYEIISRCASLLGIREPNLVPASRHDFATPEPRPADLSLDGGLLRTTLPYLAPGPIRAEILKEV